MVIMSSISDFDHMKIEELRTELGDLLLDNSEYNTDFDLLRWLQGYDYNFAHILPKLKCHLSFLRSWRQYQSDQNFTPDPLMRKFYPVGLVGLTGLDNNFLFIECMGLLDFDGILNSTPIAQVIMDRVDRIEHLFLKSIRNQETVTGEQSGICFLQDLSGLQLDIHTAVNLTTGPYKCLTHFFSNHYVETIHKFIVINPPGFMYYLYKVIRPFLPTKTADKVIILGSDWKTEILKHVDKDHLPKHWGGTLVDENGDEMCRSKVVVPIERVPLEKYWKPDPLVSIKLSELVVPAGKRKSITVFAPSAKSVINWHYNVDMDYSFAVYYSEEDGCEFDAMPMVFPLFECMSKCVKIPETQKFIATKQGFYHLVFGNNAWLYRLTVTYDVTVK